MVEQSSQDESASGRPATPRAQARERTMARIVELGNAQLAECGAAELSVREIARGLGMVSSAVYRYVSSRDELLTLLIVDAYGDLADEVDAALATVDGEDPRTRFRALAVAMIRWAIAHPERWTLLYGTPVSGYDAPAETTNADGTRVIARVLEIAAASAGDPRRDLEISSEVAALLDSHLAQFSVDAGAEAGVRAVTAWSSLVGVISAHVFRQLGADAAAIGEQILATQVELLAELLTGD
ncbi:TetR family transcriptional regulator [Brachybacterium ginsengisoli]|uniref:TetR family transcriptional regulator n=1 Tax=Brachybacterium ginsengisoli TaxID=1331682 RepID=A0A291GYQ1_9MICO|nr:TetR/AcrR family transcriptional regulator [Brachybacterium ginsengisoli]ATG55224.1 TetR family transcriptional regulator [Brachybacterium ginsengisoli]